MSNIVFRELFTNPKLFRFMVRACIGSKKDTPKVKAIDTSKFVIMSSSKSMQLSQPVIEAKLAIPKSQQEYFDSLPDSTNENVQKEVNMMSSSKSTLIFQADAVSKQKTKKVSGESREKYLMSSSKSGHIFIPDTPAINYFELKFPKIKMDSLK